MSQAGSDQVEMQCSLTIEDEFRLTKIKNKAISFVGKEREEYLWSTILKLVSRERAYKSVLKHMNVSIDINTPED